VRLSTERPEAVKAGFAKVVGVEKRGIVKAMKETLNQNGKLPDKSPYGDGTAAEKILNIIRKELNY
jgi:UDP-N-acetylglucosamine 2-epimerase (non-hydrolysing)